MDLGDDDDEDAPLGSRWIRELSLVWKNELCYPSQIFDSTPRFMHYLLIYLRGRVAALRALHEVCQHLQ
jgi:hypothetical protein